MVRNAEDVKDIEHISFSFIILMIVIILFSGFAGWLIGNDIKKLERPIKPEIITLYPMYGKDNTNNSWVLITQGTELPPPDFPLESKCVKLDDGTERVIFIVPNKPTDIDLVQSGKE